MVGTRYKPLELVDSSESLIVPTQVSRIYSPVRLTTKTAVRISLVKIQSDLEGMRGRIPFIGL